VATLHELLSVVARHDDDRVIPQAPFLEVPENLSHQRVDEGDSIPIAVRQKRDLPIGIVRLQEADRVEVGLVPSPEVATPVVVVVR